MYGYAIKDVQVDGKSIGTPSSYTFSNIDNDHTINVDWQPLGAVAVKKESGDVALSCTDRYSLAGAEYTLYADEQCTELAKDAYGDGIVLVVDSAGQASTRKVLYDGTYWLKETKASKGYRMDSVAHKIVISNGSTESVNSSEPPQRGYINVSKKSSASSLTDGNKCYSLAGAVYGVYRGGVEVARLTTDANGDTGTFTAPLGMYEVRELSPSEGYRLDPNVYTVDITADNQSKTFSSTETPLVDVFPLKLHKMDDDAYRTGHGGSAQGGLSLEGARYKVRYYDGYYSSALLTAPLSPKWEKEYVTSIDGNGQATFTVPDSDKFSDGAGQLGWALGTYVVEEMQAPLGYYEDAQAPYVLQITKATADTGECDIVVGKSDGSGTRVSADNAVLSTEEARRADLMLMKFGEPSTDSDENPDVKVPQAGVRFEIVNANEFDVYRVDAGTWAGPGEVVCSLMTDEQGYASTQDIAAAAGVRNALPLGSYIVREDPSTTHEGYAPMEDKELDVTVPNRIYRWTIENKVGTAIKIAKRDSGTGKVIRGFTTFQILDADGKVVEMDQQYPAGAVSTTFTTDIQGSVILPEKLMPGNYYIKEVKAPSGYMRTDELVPFAVDTSTVNTWQNPLLLAFSDEPSTGIITVNNIDEETSRKIVRQSSVIEVRAAEDITTADGTVRVKKGEVVHVGTTVDGTFDTGRLYPGKYEVQQRTAPWGYVRNDSAYTVDLVYANDETKTCRASIDVPNPIQKGKVVLELDDSESGLPIVSGSGIFELRTVEDIVAPDGTLRHEKGEVLEVIATGSDGKAVSAGTYPIGSYELVETKAPEDYVIDRDPLPVEIEYAGEESPEAITGNVVHDNMPQKGLVSVTKLDSETAKPVPVAGALFDVFAASDISTGDGVVHYRAGDKVSSMETGSDGKAATPGLLYLGTYDIREAKAPSGYMQGDRNSAQARLIYAGQDRETTDSAQSGISISNPPAKGSMSVVKKDAETHRRFEIAGIEIDLVAAEDIITPDGTVRHRKGDVVKELETDGTGEAFADGLYVGHYLAVEKTAPDGYLVNPTPEPVEIAYVNDSEEPKHVRVEIEDMPIKGSIDIAKVDAEDGRALGHSPAFFSVTAKDDIVTADGTLRTKAGQRVTEVKTGKNGHAVADGLYPGTYVVEELSAPYGYLRSEESVEVELSASGANKNGHVSASTTVEDKIQKAVIELVKKDRETGKPITESPATFDVVASNDIVTPDGQLKHRKGDVVDTITTGDDGKAQTKELYIGTYELVEKIPPEHYLANPETVRVTTEYDKETPGTIEVSVEHDAIMPRGTVEIDKVSAADGKTPLEGAEFSLVAAAEIRGGDGTVHFSAGDEVSSCTTDEKGHAEMKGLRQGSYKLVETKAPDGYLTAPDSNVEIWYEPSTGSSEDGTADSEGSSSDEKSGVLPDESDTSSGFEATPSESEDAGTGSTGDDADKEDPGVEDGTDAIDIIDVVEVKLVVEDEPITASIAKEDEMGAALPGCELSLYEKADSGALGEKIDSWNTGTEEHVVSPIPEGDYVLVEDAACEGYDVADPVEIHVGTDNEKNKFVLVNKKSELAAELVETSPLPEEPTPLAEWLPQAGDAPVLLMVAVMSSAAVAWVSWRARRRKKS